MRVRSTVWVSVVSNSRDLHKQFPVGGSLAGVEFRDAGRKQLKGIKDRQRVFEVVW